MEFRLLVHGDRACFKRPEFAEDVVTYDVITPLAARGIFEAVHGTPAMRWRIDEIRVLRPIRSTWMSLAEVEGGDAGAALIDRIFGGRRDRRMANVLTDVAYAVTAHMEPTGRAGPLDPVVENAALFSRRAARGRFFRQPFLGLRGFDAGVALIDADDPLPDSALSASGAIDLGWMIYDIERDGDGMGGERLRLFRAVMIDGVIDLRRLDALILAG